MRPGRCALLIAAVLSVTAPACSRAEPEPVAVGTVPAPATAPVPSSTTTTAPADDGWTLTAVPHGAVQGYDGPDGAPTTTVTNTYYDIPVTLPVIDHEPGWLHVRTPYKPNGSTAWIRQSDADMGSTPWKIVVDLPRTRLRLYRAGDLVLDAPVGIGTDATPTATGEFFVTHRQEPPSAAYGPFVLITSGHSEVIQVWEGFPDGILAIHGPVGADALIGDDGARISNGCIRMHVADQQLLAEVTPGTPVRILAA